MAAANQMPTAEPSSPEFSLLPSPIAKAKSAFWLVVLLALTASVYWSGLAGPFVFDDYNNIVDNPRLRIESASLSAFWQATLAGDAGPLKRPLSMLSFAANHLLSGLAPFPYKLTNLCIHLVNGLLVFALCRRLLTLMPVRTEVSHRNEEGIPLAASAIWMLHPVQLTSVLYVVQRMTSLSATFVLSGLLIYLSARQARSLQRRLLLLWFGVPLCGLLAAMAKENGLLIFLYAYVIELMIFKYTARPDEQWGTPKQFFALTVGLPLLAIAAYLLFTPEWFAYAAANRPFTVVERLWTESRVLFHYLYILFVPVISNMALFYDDFEISRGWFEPITTSLSIAALSAILVLALKNRRAHPWFAFSVLWFLAGHAMESTIVNLELIHAHRNYIAYIGPMLAVCVYAERHIARSRRRLGWVLTIATILSLAAVTGLRANQWRHPLDLAAYEVIHRPNSARANYEIARLLNIVAVKTDNEAVRADAVRYLRRAAQLEPDEISSLIGIAVASRGIFPEDVLNEIIRRLRERPMGLNQVGYVQSLIDCQRTRACRTPPEQVQAIFAAMLEQPALRPRVKAEVLTMLGIYYVERLADVRAGVKLMMEAVTIQPDDPARYINLAQAQMFDIDPTAAIGSLSQATSLDSLGAYKVKIDALRRDVESRVNPEAGEGSTQPVDSNAAATTPGERESAAPPMAPKTQTQLQKSSSLVKAAPRQFAPEPGKQMD